MLEKKKKKDISGQNKLVLSTEVIGDHLNLKRTQFVATGYLEAFVFQNDSWETRF